MSVFHWALVILFSVVVLFKADLGVASDRASIQIFLKNQDLIVPIEKDPRCIYSACPYELPAVPFGRSIEFVVRLFPEIYDSTPTIINYGSIEILIPGNGFQIGDDNCSGQFFVPDVNNPEVAVCTISFIYNSISLLPTTFSFSIKRTDCKLADPTDCKAPRELFATVIGHGYQAPQFARQKGMGQS